jgi:hypothetical protein
MNEPHKLITNKTDKEIATEIKQELIDAFDPILKIVDKAKEAGFNVSFSIGPNAFGKMHIAQMAFHKEF